MLSNAIVCYYANCKECRLKELSFYRKILQVDDRRGRKIGESWPA